MCVSLKAIRQIGCEKKDFDEYRRVKPFPSPPLSLAVLLRIGPRIYPSSQMMSILLLSLLLRSVVSFSVTAPPSLLNEYGKLFGRLADKFILLDSSAGKCCYSGCSDCEFRLPDGGYRMSEQSSSRAKWICSYRVRDFTDKSHTSKWSSIFDDEIVLEKSAFIENVQKLEFAESLGPPFISKRDAQIVDPAVLHHFWSKLSVDDKPLTAVKMQRRLKKLCGEEEGMTWSMFQKGIIDG